MIVEGCQTVRRTPNLNVRLKGKVPFNPYLGEVKEKANRIAVLNRLVTVVGTI